MFFFFFQAEDGIRDLYVTGVQTCALPIFETDRGITQRTRQRVQGTHGISCAKRVPSTNLQQTRDLTRATSATSPLVVAGMRQVGEKPRREIWWRMVDRLRESVELALGNGGYSCTDG